MQKPCQLWAIFLRDGVEQKLHCLKIANPKKKPFFRKLFFENFLKKGEGAVGLYVNKLLPDFVI